MFSGIIHHLGEIISVRGTENTRQVQIAAPKALLANRPTGASIACNGICLTATSIADDNFSVDISPETCATTTAGKWQTGHLLNLEASLRLGDEISGHFVFGHVDTTSTVLAIIPINNYYECSFTYNNSIKKMVARKGSIAIDGVSLTVNAINEHAFSVMIIPHTWAHTTLGRLKTGDTVNLEADMLARYSARYHEATTL